MNHPAAGSMFVSSTMFPERECFDAWRETFALKAVRVDVAVPDKTIFRAATRARALGELALVASTYSPLRVMRTRELLRDGNDDVPLVIVLAGHMEMKFGDRSVRIEAGEGTLAPVSLLGGMESRDEGATLTVMMPRALATRIAGGANLPILRPIAASNPALRLIKLFSTGIVHEPGPFDAPTVQMANQQLCELFANLFAPGSDLARAEAAGGVQAARLQAIKADIMAKLEQSDLSVASIAASHRLPVRYVQRLFEAEGTTFTEFVLSARLALAQRILTRSRNADLKISAVAISAGFGSLSYFNEAFRRRYGASPSDVRAQAQRES